MRKRNGEVSLRYMKSLEYDRYIDYFKLVKKKGNSQILCEQLKKGAEAQKRGK